MRKQLIAILLFGVLVGCSSTPARQTNEPLLPGPTEPAEPATSESTRFSRIEMIDASVGWGITGSGVVRTDDGGKTWTTVSPEVLELPDRPIAFFLDGRTGWVAGQSVVGQDNQGRFPIYRTADGGKTWQSATADGFDLKQITFADEHRGWALRHDGVATGGTEFVTLLGTADGGQTWKPVAQAGPPGAPTTFPTGGMKSGVAFASEATGWATGGYTNVGALFFYKTIDGGATWAPAELPVPARMQTNETRVPLLRTRPPWIFADGRMVLALTGLCEEKSCTVFMHSGDGGKTWRGTPPMEYSLSEQMVAEFLDPDHGWLALGARLYATEDGGQTWTERSSLSGVSALDFVSPTVGWALADGKLWRTDDGGRSWR